MGHRPDPVTSDWQVAQAMVGEPQEEDLCWLSNEIAASLSITVFQITARLKGMEGRKLVERYEGYWRLTKVGYQLGTGPEPPQKEKIPLGDRVYRTPTGGYYTPRSEVVALPDDSKVPKKENGGWRIRYLYGPKESIPIYENRRLIGTYYLSRHQVEVFIDPEGVEWVKCAPTEPAELLAMPPAEGLSIVRLCRRTGSTAAERQIRRHEDTREEILERDEARRARKRK